MNKLFFITLSILAITSASSFSEEDKWDAIHLKNGFVVEGDIIELSVNEYVKIKLITGIVNTYKMSDIVKIEKVPRPKNLKPPPGSASSPPPPIEKVESSTETIEPPRGKIQPIQRDIYKKIDPKPPGYRSAGTAFILSFLFTGAGQFYNGEVGKGLAQILMVTTGVVLIISETNEENRTYYPGFGYRVDQDEGLTDLQYVGLVMGISGALWSMIDAPISAKKNNKKLALADPYGHLIQMETGQQIVGIDLGFDGKSLGGKITLHF